MRWLAFITLVLFCGSARAEVNVVRFAQQFSMGYLQFNVMKHQNLLAKHAQRLGLGELKTVFVTFNGPDMMNDALLSGSIDIASGGMPGLLTIWAKTKGSAQEVRGVSAISQQPLLLNSPNPTVDRSRISPMPTGSRCGGEGAGAGRAAGDGGGAGVGRCGV
jgi:NitT/TauT family transport system substrate-binding protein